MSGEYRLCNLYGGYGAEHKGFALSTHLHFVDSLAVEVPFAVVCSARLCVEAHVELIG